jgi:arylsulfatase A-like enzyme
MFQELLRVPLILSGPGVASGRRVACATSLVDVAPTALLAMGLSPLPEMRGVALQPVIASGARGAIECRDRPVVAESTAYGPEQRAVWWRQMKLIERVDGVTLLYDLGTDPAEQADLAGSRPEEVEQLRRRLEAALAPGPEAMATGDAHPAEYDKDTLQQLRELGYVEPE